MALSAAVLFVAVSATLAVYLWRRPSSSGSSSVIVDYKTPLARADAGDGHAVLVGGNGLRGHSPSAGDGTGRPGAPLAGGVDGGGGGGAAAGSPMPGSVHRRATTPPDETDPDVIPNKHGKFYTTTNTSKIHLRKKIC